jgi:hypothetical protein
MTNVKPYNFSNGFSNWRNTLYKYFVVEIFMIKITNLIVRIIRAHRRQPTHSFLVFSYLRAAQCLSFVLDVISYWECAWFHNAFPVMQQFSVLVFCYFFIAYRITCIASTLSKLLSIPFYFYEWFHFSFKESAATIVFQTFKET